eukprot:Nk52_evm9s2531 gene=Nk52_evmTU9s2531
MSEITGNYLLMKFGRRSSSTSVSSSGVGAYNTSSSPAVGGPCLDKLAGLVPQLLDDDFEMGEADDMFNECEITPKTKTSLQGRVTSLDSSPAGSVAANAFAFSHETVAQDSFPSTDAAVPVVQEKRESTKKASLSSLKPICEEDIVQPLEANKWLYIELSREGSERILKNYKEAFLVRTRSDDMAPYCVSYIVSGNVLHTKLFYENGKYRLGTEKNEFESVGDLILYYSKTPLVAPGTTEKFTLKTPAVYKSIENGVYKIKYRKRGSSKIATSDN